MTERIFAWPGMGRLFLDHMQRFDVPVVGPATIETAAESGVNAIVVEAGSTLLLGKDDIFRLCKEKKVSLVARSTGGNLE